MSAKNIDYQKKKRQLDELLNWFTNENDDIDLAIEKYQQAIKIISELEKFLKDTEAKINIVIKKK